MIEEGGPPLSHPSCQFSQATTRQTMNRRLIDLFQSATEERIRPTLDLLFPEETEDLIGAFRRLRETHALRDVRLVLRLNRDGDEVLVPVRGSPGFLRIVPSFHLDHPPENAQLSEVGSATTTCDSRQIAGADGQRQDVASQSQVPSKQSACEFPPTNRLQGEDDRPTPAASSQSPPDSIVLRIRVMP